MGHLVGDPDRNERRREPHAVGFRVGFSREVLQADEDCGASTHDELARVRRAHAHHQIAVDRPVRTQQLGGAPHRLLGDRYDVLGSKEGVEIASVGAECCGDDIGRLLRVRIEHIIPPVRIEDRPVGVPVARVRCLGIVGFEYGEEGRNEVDEHAP